MREEARTRKQRALLTSQRPHTPSWAHSSCNRNSGSSPNYQEHIENGLAGRSENVRTSKSGYASGLEGSPAVGGSCTSLGVSNAVGSGSPGGYSSGSGGGGGGRCNGCLRRCLLVVGFLYFQLSTYTLLQWIKQHVPHEQLHYRNHPDSARSDGDPHAVAPLTSADDDAHRGTQRLPAVLAHLEGAGEPLRSQRGDSPLQLSLPSAAAGGGDGDEGVASLGRTAGAAAGTFSEQRQARGSVASALPDNAATAKAPAASGATAVSTRTGTADRFAPAGEAAGVSEDGSPDEEEPKEVDEEPSKDGTLDAKIDISAAGLDLDEGIKPVSGSDSADAMQQLADNGDKKMAWIESDAYGKFIGISTFFNPGRHENKVDNFRKFRRSVQEQGLQMLCVELVFGQASFQLGDDDCEILIHRRTAEGNTLWQKERLLNIALENLPNTVEKVMWLDSDLIFLNDNWVPETAELLDQFPVVQPFGWMTYLPADAGVEYAEERLPTLPLGQGVGGVYHSAGLGISSFGDIAFKANFMLGHPGFAWAARREVICAAGFYDRSIIGGGDRIMVNAFTGHFSGVSRKMPPAMAQSVKAFGRKLAPLVGPANVSFTQGVVLHIWHGDRANRDYTHRYEILLSNRYDPSLDVRVNSDGVLEWASDKPNLHKQVTEYFENRKEGPRPNASHEEVVEEEDEMTLQKRVASRAVRSYVGYHCRSLVYRPACKIAFRMWGDALRFTQLQLHQKQLRKLQAEQAKQFREAREREKAKKAAKKNKKPK